MADSTADSNRAYDERPRPLAGVRVVDFTWIVAGPQATRILADFGADVIRVENEGHLDSLRGGLPPDDGPPTVNRSGIFNNFNRNKRGITANIHHPRTRELLEQLIAGADAVTENYSPGAFGRMGFTFERLRELNPNIIYLSLSGFGHYGRDSSYVTWGPTAQAVSGLTYLSGLPDQPPAGWGYSYLDHSAGYYGAIALLLALRRRERIEGAQRIDLSQVEDRHGDVRRQHAGLADQRRARPSASATARVTPRSRPTAPTAARATTAGSRSPSRARRTGANFATNWARPELADDKRFASLAARLAAQDELGRGDRGAHARARSAGADVRAAGARRASRPWRSRCRTRWSMTSSWQRAASTAPHPAPSLAIATSRACRSFSASSAGTCCAARPTLGEHIDEVLTELGCTPEEIAQLRAEAAV